MRVSSVLFIASLAGCGFRISGGTGAVDDAGLDAQGEGDADVDAMMPGDDAEIDPTSDAMIDAPPALQCLSSYVTLGSVSTSRYRLITTGASVVAQHNACVGDGAHLAVIDNAIEAAVLRQLVDGTSGLPNVAGYTLVYVGSAQLPNQANKSTGWISATGPFTAGFWETNEPNDGSGSEDGEEQFAAIWRNHDTLADIGKFSLGALCECDGKPVTVEFQGLMTAAQ